MRFGSAVTTRGGTESVGEQHGCCKGALATASVYCECMRLCQRPLPPLNDLRSELTRPRREPPPRTPLPAPSEPAGGAVPASGAVPEPAPRPSVPAKIAETREGGFASCTGSRPAKAVPMCNKLRQGRQSAAKAIRPATGVHSAMQLVS